MERYDDMPFEGAAIVLSVAESGGGYWDMPIEDSFWWYIETGVRDVSASVGRGWPTDDERELRVGDERAIGL